MQVPYAVEQNVDDYMQRATCREEHACPVGYLAVSRHWIMQVQTLTANDLSPSTLGVSQGREEREGIGYEGVEDFCIQPFYSLQNGRPRSRPVIHLPCGIEEQSFWPLLLYDTAMQLQNISQSLL